MPARRRGVRASCSGGAGGFKRIQEGSGLGFESSRGGVRVKNCCTTFRITLAKGSYPRSGLERDFMNNPQVNGPYNPMAGNPVGA